MEYSLHKCITAKNYFDKKIIICNICKEPYHPTSGAAAKQDANTTSKSRTIPMAAEIHLNVTRRETTHHAIQRKFDFRNSNPKRRLIFILPRHGKCLKPADRRHQENYKLD